MRPLLSFLVALPTSGCLWISAADHAKRTDIDGDGFPADQDCDDSQIQVYPGALERPCDQLDNDCNPETADGPVWVGRAVGGEGEAVLGTFPNIRTALERVEPGGVVGLCLGTFEESVAIDKPGVVLAGSGKPEQTVLDATGLGKPAIEVRAENVVLQQLTVMGGTGQEVGGRRYGGGVAAMAAGGDLKLVQVDLVGNEADHGGGLAWSGAGTLTLQDTTISDNIGRISGGGLSLGGTANMDGVIITANSGERGGGLVLVGGSVTGVGEGVRIENNTANLDGGGLLLEEGTLQDASVEGNVSLMGAGGGIYGRGTLNRVSVSGNTAQAGGGVAASGRLELHGGVIKGNTASGDGGGLLVLEGANAIVGSDEALEQTTSFESNTANARGGHLAVLGSLQLFGADMVGGQAFWGGAVALAADCEDCSSELKQAHFESNKATEGGGAVWASAHTDLIECKFLNNDAVTGGAVLAVGRVFVLGPEGGGNTASLNGGFASVAPDGVLEVSNGEINGNRASEGGAAIFADGLVELSDLVISSSQCENCGALTVGAGSFLLDGVEFSNNNKYDFSFPGETGCSVGAGAPIDGQCDGLGCVCEPAP